jgi:hypothetical protein
MTRLAPSSRGESGAAKRRRYVKRNPSIKPDEWAVVQTARAGMTPAQGAESLSILRVLSACLTPASNNIFARR